MAIDTQAVAYAITETSLSAHQVMNVLNLLIEEQCTIPFITRYRKEVTGGLDEVQIKDIQDAYERKVEIEKRRIYILDAIKKMEKLTPELDKQINACETLNQLEDIYAPYKSKKKTKGQIADEAGLTPLAEIILTTNLDLVSLNEKYGTEFINPEFKINNFKDAFSGACDIIVEKIAHDPELKEELRQRYWKDALIKSTKRKGAEEIKAFDKFQDYFEFSQNISDLKTPKVAHRFLAMRRGMTLKILKVDVIFELEEALQVIYSKYVTGDVGLKPILEQCSIKAYSNNVHPSLDLEVKSELKKYADEAAIDVFGVNLKNLLLQPYLGPKCVMGVDPGVRTGCKIVVVDNTGKFLVDKVVYPHPPQNQIGSSAQILDAMIEHFNVENIAIGNGTYGRETLAFIEKNVPSVKSEKVKATIISESGASIYSTSEIARKEFPDKDPTVRGAVSIARRFQDPLAELVKLDPKSIGVGQYQHDVNQSRLKKSLTGVVESCVNYVGVDLNTASAPLLSYISGIGPTLAQNVVKYRESSGGFKNRTELLSVPRFSKKVFEQAAGFLRIYKGEQPLDATFIHPERYEVISSWANSKSTKLEDLSSDIKLVSELERDNSFKEQVGEFTHEDIVKSLKAPSQDPRTEFKSTEFRKDISSIADLTEGEWYPGIVTNITQFGAFVDIGIKENGLLHVSQISDTFIDNALEALTVGETLKVKIIGVDIARKRISLSCKQGSRPEDSVQSSYGNSQNKKTPKKFKDNNASLKNNAFAALKNFKIK